MKKPKKHGGCVILRGPHVWRFVVGHDLGDRIEMATRLAQLAHDDDYPFTPKDADKAVRAMNL